MPTTSHEKMNESNLVAWLQERDKAALSYLYDHYSAALYGVVIRIVNDEKIAEEVLQDSFMKIWNKIDSYDQGKGRLFTWMLNISKNLAIDKLRSKEIKKVRKTDDIEDNVYNIDQSHLVVQYTDGIGIKELLAKLRPEETFVLDKVYFGGYTQAEVSEQFDIPLGTVKTRLRMALKSLRKELGIA